MLRHSLRLLLSLALVAAVPAGIASAEGVPSTRQSEIGRELYVRLECFMCHGAGAEGDMGPTLAATRLDLAAVRGQLRAPRSRQMPAFGPDKVDDAGVEAIWTYLRSLPPPSLKQKRTWWGTDALNLPTPRLPDRREFEVHFGHRFSDSVADAGFEGLYGLDSFAFPGFWFMYGIHERVAPYFGRTANFATWEYGVKLGVLREGDLGVPLSAAVNVGGTYLDADGIPNAGRFVIELPIGIRVTDRFALEAVPFYTTNPDEFAEPGSPGYAIAIGVGGSLKVTTRISLDGEWIVNVGGFRRHGAVDQWQAGMTFNVGKHMFQLLLSNSVLTTPDFMAGGTLRTGVDSNIRVGFNLVRGFYF